MHAALRLSRFARPLALGLSLAALPTLALPAAVAEKLDHVHVTIKLVVAASNPRPAGDVLGLYAAEVLSCKADKAASTGRAAVLGWLDRATDLLMSSAWANHRDRFDRAGAMVVSTRVPLDRAASFNLGEVTLPQGSYCHIRLTLTRLPALAKPAPLAPLDTSLRLTRPGALPPVALSYPVALELPLPKPWQARHGAAAMTITLDPGSSDDLLADASLSEGAIVRLVSARWVERSKTTLTAPR